jgi:hypothetical protein
MSGITILLQGLWCVVIELVAAAGTTIVTIEARKTIWRTFARAPPEMGWSDGTCVV